jgi:hypothetical protein
MRKMDSAASRVWATCTVSTPRAQMVLRKKRAAIQVVMPIWRALTMMFCRPRVRSNWSCAGLGMRGLSQPLRSRMRRCLRASWMGYEVGQPAAGRSSKRGP